MVSTLGSPPFGGPGCRVLGVARIKDWIGILG